MYSVLAEGVSEFGAGGGSCFQRGAQLASQIDLAPTLLGLLNLSYESTFFGRNLLQRNPLPPRVVIGNYQHLGLFDGEDLALLSPRRLMRRHDDALGRSQESATSRNDPLIRREIAYYQGASHAFESGLMSWKQRTATKP